MKLGRILTILLLPVTRTALGSETLDLDRLDRCLECLISYEYGQSKGIDLGWVERQVAMSATDPTDRAVVEKSLLEALGDATTIDAKQFLLRQLFAVGTDTSVPLLEPLLADETLSHLARLALSGIGSPSSEDALLWGLDNTSGAMRAGIINTLADMQCVKAKKRVMKLMRSWNREVSIAAIKATGRFGGQDAVRALKRVRPRRTNQRQLEVDASLLRCAEAFRREGQQEKAAEIFRRFYKKRHPLHLRLAGLRGLVATEGKKGRIRLEEAIREGDPDFRKNAVALMAGLEGSDITETLIDLAKTLPAEGQESVVRALASRGDVSAAPEVMRWTESGYEEVRLAAVEALGDIGTPQSIRCLAEAAAEDRGRIRQVSRESLVRLDGPGVKARFIEEANKGEPPVREEIIRAMGERESRDAFPVLQRIAEEEQEDEVRQEAILSLGKIGVQQDFPVLLRLLLSPLRPEDRPTIRKALVTLFQFVEDKEPLSAGLASAMKEAEEEAQVELLALLSKTATRTALEEVVAHTDSSVEAVRDAAVRSLADWPNPAPAEILYEIAAGRENQIHSTLAFRAYVRLAGLTDDPTGAYVKAFDIAENDQEVKLVLGGLGGTRTIEALDIAEAYMRQESVKDEATLAAVRIAARICWAYPDRARRLLDRVLEETQRLRAKEEAKRAIEKMDRWQHYIFAWKGTGPYTIEGVQDGGTVFQTPFEPEQDPSRGEIDWTPVRCELEGDRLDLHATFGDLDYCCAYLITTIRSPEARKARIHWSADDRIKGWLNGEPIGAEDVSLEEGDNRLMVKVVDNEGGWNVNCRLTHLDNTPMTDLKFLAE